MDKKRKNCYFGLNFIDVKDEMGQNIFLILDQLHLQVMKNQNSLEASA